jgi:hypothetical protein
MITAQIASIRERARMLENTIQSLYVQVDHINVMLNNYPFTPSFLKDYPGVTVYHLDNLKGDAAKFYKIPEGIIFLCDDDLIYPTDYVAQMVWKLDEYAGKAIITNHGRIMNPKPVKNAYTDRKDKFHCLEEVLDEKEIDIGGTGVMAFCTSYFKPDYESVTIPNMADIWVAKWAKEQGCKIIINPHYAGWIEYQYPDGETIWDQHYFNPEQITDFYNSF